MTLPSLRLQKGKDAAIKAGNPWVFKGDIIDSSALLLIEKGGLVELRTHKDAFIGIGYYNHEATLCCRLLTLRNEPIDAAFFETRLRAAIARKQAYAATGYYRVIHAEADFLAGLVVDQFGDVLSIQLGTAGMVRLWPAIEQALQVTIKPKGMVVHFTGPAHEA